MKRLRFTTTTVALAVLVGLTCAAPAYAAPVKKGVAAAVQCTASGIVYGSEGPVVPGATVGVNLMDKSGVYAPVATLATDGLGHWFYGGKTGQYRFDFSAYGMAPQTQYLSMPDKTDYTLDVTLQQLYCSISGHAYIGVSKTPMSSCMVSFYRQNADGTWPATSISWGAVTASDGSYSTGNLAPGVYRVRFFGVHTGTQYWAYVATYAEATSVELSVPGDMATGIDGWFGMP